MSTDLAFSGGDRDLLLGLRQSVSSKSLLPEALCNRVLELDLQIRDGNMDVKETSKLARAAKLEVKSDVYWLFVKNAADSSDSRVVKAIVGYLTEQTVIRWVLKKSHLPNVPIDVLYLVLMELHNGKPLKEDPALQYLPVLEGLFLPLFPYMVHQASLRGSG